VAGLGGDAVGVGRGGHAQRHDLGQALRPVRRIQPVVAQGGEFVGGFGDGFPPFGLRLSKPSKTLRQAQDERIKQALQPPSRSSLVTVLIEHPKMRSTDRIEFLSINS
jgi:hypothetical protein